MVKFNFVRACMFVFALVLVGGFSSVAVAEDTAWTSHLPNNIIWTSYDVTASGYIHAAAMADAIHRTFGTNIRIIPSGNGMGRIIPLAQGRASYAFLGDEAMFSFDGTFDFADMTWGPQNIRTVLANPSVISFFTSRENFERGMVTPADFRGARLAYRPGDPTHNVKLDAFLAFAQLTRDDVEIVNFPSFTATNRAVIERTNDLGIGVPTGPIFFEIDASPVGLYRVEFPASETEAWARFNEIYPTFFPTVTTVGPAIHREGGIEEVGFRFPHIVTLADSCEDEVYAVTRALVETFELYKNIDQLSPNWHVSGSSMTPVSAPFHPGAVRFFREIGEWNDEKEAWNNEAIARGARLQEAWEVAVQYATENRLSTSDFAAHWENARIEANRPR